LPHSAGTFFIVFLTTLSVTAIAQDSGTALPSAACASLQGMSIPASAIGLPTGGAVVQAATPVAASAKDNPNGDFCKVTGIVKPHNPSSPNLEFEVNLPTAWNRRVLQMGGGGYNGSLVTGLAGFTLQPANVENPLKQGFVTVGTDGGHKAPPGFDGSFAMDDEALRNFGKESVKKGHDAAIEIIKKAYGRALSQRLRRRRGELPGLQRHAASPRFAQCGTSGVRRRRRGVAESGENETDHRRGVRQV